MKYHKFVSDDPEDLLKVPKGFRIVSPDILKEVPNISELASSYYDSPIKIITKQIDTKVVGEVITAIQHFGIDIDEDELMRVLRQDRTRYEEAWKSGYYIALTELALTKAYSDEDPEGREQS